MAAKTISTIANMGFGRFVAGSGGTIVIGANGARSRTGGVILLGSNYGAAGFLISGNDNKVTILTLPANGAVSLASGVNRLPLNNFVSNLPAGGVIPTGTQTVLVGATLQVAPSQPRGNYAGAFQAILEFQ